MNTQQARDQFREHISGFWKSGREYGKPYGDASGLARVEFPTTLRPSGRLTLLVHPVAQAAFMALASVMLHHDYWIRETASGTLSWRNIAGSSLVRIAEQVRRQYPLATSLHAHGMAIDLNPSANAFGGTRYDFPAQMVTDVQAIRTVNGFPVWAWGITFRDPMHWQPTRVGNRADLAAGIDVSTVRGWAEYLSWGGEVEMILKKGDRNELVGFYQRALNGWPGLSAPLTVDEVFGDATEAAVKAYQAAARVEQTGVIAGVLAPALARYHPDIAADAHTHEATVTLA